MKKLALAIAAVLASGTAFAETAVNDLSDVSSTADAPNNLYDFIDNDMLSGSAYGGAELGGHLLFDNDNDTFEHGYMFKVGADFRYTVSDSLALLMGGEARYEWTGTDTSVDANPYIDRFEFGVETVIGTTTFGKHCGTVDSYAGFGDLGKEYGIGEYFEDGACGDELIDHRFTAESLDIGVSYVPAADAYGIGGSYALGHFIVGGAWAANEDVAAYSVGLVGSFDELTAAVKYAANDHDDKNADNAAAYSAGLAYQFTVNLNASTTYNVDDLNDDDWVTVGASYRLNEHVELVTDLKLASEDDDKMFLRANVNF